MDEGSTYHTIRYLIQKCQRVQNHNDSLVGTLSSTTTHLAGSSFYLRINSTTHKSITSVQKVHGTQSIVFAICFSHIRYLLRNPPSDHSFHPHTYTHHFAAMFENSINSHHYLTTHGMFKESRARVTKLSMGNKQQSFLLLGQNGICFRSQFFRPLNISDV